MAPPLDPRLLTKAEAAAYCGLTPSGFSTWIKAGRLPRPIQGTRRWDRAAIDAALDKLSGIWRGTKTPEEEEADRWLREYEERQSREQSLADDPYSHMTEVEILRMFRIKDPRKPKRRGGASVPVENLSPRVQAVLKKECERRGVPWE